LKDTKGKKEEEPRPEPLQEPTDIGTPNMQDWDKPEVRTTLLIKGERPDEHKRELTEHKDEGDS
jgi:hypothetical protein